MPDVTEELELSDAVEEPDDTTPPAPPDVDEPDTKSDEEPPSEDPDDEKEVDDRDEPPVEPPPPADEDESVAPTIVQEMAPELAGEWGSLTESQRAASMHALIRTVDRGTPEEQGDDGANEDGKPNEEPVDARPSAEPSAPESKPLPFSDEDLQAALDELGVEPDSKIAQLLKTVAQQAAQADDTSRNVARDAVELFKLTKSQVDKTSAQVLTLSEDRELETALVAHADDFRGMTKADLRQIEERAKAIKKDERRTDKFHDAVSIALWERQREASAAPKGSSKERAEAAKLASSLATGPRGRSAKGRAEPPPGLNASDLARWLDKEMRAGRVK